MRSRSEVLAIFQEHDGVIGFAKFTGAFDNSLENRPNIGRRGRDHAENVGAPGLISQRLREVAGLGLHLVEQPDVLDGDHGLVGEGLYQFDLLVAEWLDAAASQTKTPMTRRRAPAERRGRLRKLPSL